MLRIIPGPNSAHENVIWAPLMTLGRVNPSPYGDRRSTRRGLPEERPRDMTCTPLLPMDLAFPRCEGRGIILGSRTPPTRSRNARAGKTYHLPIFPLDIAHWGQFTTPLGIVAGDEYSIHSLSPALGSPGQTTYPILSPVPQIEKLSGFPFSSRSIAAAADAG